MTFFTLVAMTLKLPSNAYRLRGHSSVSSEETREEEEEEEGEGGEEGGKSLPSTRKQGKDRQRENPKRKPPVSLGIFPCTDSSVPMH